MHPPASCFNMLSDTKDVYLYMPDHWLEENQHVFIQ